MGTGKKPRLVAIMDHGPGSVTNEELRKQIGSAGPGCVRTAGRDACRYDAGEIPWFTETAIL